jgi:hypothetical protein
MTKPQRRSSSSTKAGGYRPAGGEGGQHRRLVGAEREYVTGAKGRVSAERHRITANPAKRSTPAIKSWVLQRKLSVMWPWRIDILEGVNPAGSAFRSARAAAATSETPLLPALGFTEAEPRWVLLYDHIRTGQIHPSKLRRMPRGDLEFIVAHRPGPVPDDGSTDLARQRREAAVKANQKLMGNVARAEVVLRRRDVTQSSLWAAFIGAAVGGAVAAVITSPPW